MTLKTYRLSILLLMLFCILAVTTSLPAQYAQKAYEQADYETAVRLLEKQRAAGKSSVQLYCDLGNAYYKLGNHGAAVLNFQKALRLDPADSQARNNLKYLENMVQIANESLLGGKNMDPTPAEVGFFDSLGNSISHRGSNCWAWIALVFFILTLCGVALYLFSRAVGRRKLGFFGSIFCLALCAVAVWFAVISKRYAQSKHYCVLMADEQLLRLKADENAETVATPLSAGTVFKAISHAKDASDGEWTEVYLNSEYSGWVPSTDLAVIEVDEISD